MLGFDSSLRNRIQRPAAVIASLLRRKDGKQDDQDCGPDPEEPEAPPP
jgi:hypothetical protein